MKIKRVALVHSSGFMAFFTENYPANARDIDILNALYEVGKNVWYGKSLYRILYDADGHPAYFKYEIYTTSI